MKRIVINQIVMSMMAIFLVSCEKSDISSFEGSYTYKTSGKVALLPTAWYDATSEEKAYMEAMGISYEPVWIALEPEQGQMHIRAMDEDNDLVIITFNDLFGNACKIGAVIESDSITIDGSGEKSMRMTDGTETLAGGFVTYTGEGVRYDDIIVMDFRYEGKVTVNGTGMTIADSRIECIATKNR